MTYTVVCFHAHPDDEALLTGGTMARLAAEGHRVVLVVATAGEAGLTSASLAATTPLGDLRLAELSRSAEALGCARMVDLGFADSGMDGNAHTGGQRFCAVAVEDAANRLLAVLREENAHVLTIYDGAGGYGHPDHVQVHRVGVRAAELAATPVVLEATIDRRALRRALRLIGCVTRGTPGFQPRRFAHAFADPELITHRVNIGPYWRQKRSALQAHATQAQADDEVRTLAWILRLPTPLFRLVFRHEWFVEHGRRRGPRLQDDVLDTLRQASIQPMS
jgi:LmbE family N-acetylglucosaminyl deacetylase